jgi:hypothetical protein
MGEKTDTELGDPDALHFIQRISEKELSIVPCSATDPLSGCLLIPRNLVADKPLDLYQEPMIS